MVVKSSVKPFRVTWKNLRFVSKPSWPSKAPIKVILDEVNGFFESGQVMAMMGPSGCGKSTLLSCICGQRKQGLSGSIAITPNQKVKFSFICQENYILERLTVNETLLFASRLKNGPNADHRMIVNDVINKLMLNNCVDTMNKRCSGGQLKRILIGQELVSRPNVLILDEPTSGLDTTTTRHLVGLLLRLTRGVEPLAIVLTIHQPSAKLFMELSQIYLLSRDGQAIYCGSPQEMNKFFVECGLFCPPFSSLSDFALEVASKEHGGAPLSLMATMVKMEAKKWPPGNYAVNRDHAKTSINDIIMLTLRSYLTVFRDPTNLSSRIFSYVFVSIFISLLYGNESGQYSGCHHEFTIEKGVDLMEKWKRVGNHLGNNFSMIGFATYFAYLTSISPVLLTIPAEFNVFLQEYRNGSYSKFSYFMSKMLTELPINLLLPNIGALIIFFMTGQYIGDLFRVVNYCLLFVILSINGSAMGLMISSALPQYPMAVVSIGSFLLFPQILFSGTLIPLHEMKMVMRWMTVFDNMRFGIEANMINIYGFDRCSTGQPVNETDIFELIPADKMFEIVSSDKIDIESLFKNLQSMMSSDVMTDDNIPFLMRVLRLYDSYYWIALAMLFLHSATYYLSTYLFILMKN